MDNEQIVLHALKKQKKLPDINQEALKVGAAIPLISGRTDDLGASSATQYRLRVKIDSQVRKESSSTSGFNFIFENNSLGSGRNIFSPDGFPRHARFYRLSFTSIVFR